MPVHILKELGKPRVPFVNGKMFAMYLHHELQELLGTNINEFKRIKTELPREEFKKRFSFHVFTGDSKIVITQGNVFEAMRPFGVDQDLWRAFIATMIQEYGIEGAVPGIITYLNEAIKRKVYTYLELFGLYVPIGKFDPSKLDPDVLAKLPKDIRNYLVGDTASSGDKTPPDNAGILA